MTAQSVPLAVGLVMASTAAYAQESGSDSVPIRTLSIVPRVSITETLTNNVGLSSVDPQSDLVTEISPGIRIDSQGRRLKGYLDYSLDKITYAQNSSSNQYQRALNTAGTLEAIDNWAYIDFSGSISRQAISAFGTPSISNTSINTNQTEVSSYRISPYVRGRLGDLASYEARYSRAITNSDAAGGFGNVSSTDGSAKISGDSAIRGLGWSADASQQKFDYSASLPVEADRFTVGPSYAITPQLRVSANVGRERNNYTTADMQSYGNSGFGVNWTPSTLTTLSASLEHRSFGNSHNLSFEHRTGRTAWKFTDSKDILQTPNQLGVVSLGSIYDLLYGQFASIEPNPAARAQLVNAFLQANGLSPNATAVSNVLTSAISLQRSQNLSFALLGVRDTITFMATRLQSSPIDASSTASNALTNSLFVNQRGFSVNYTHRLTPDYSLGVLASQQNASGLSGVQGTKLRLLNLNVTGRVGKQTTASVGVRRVVSSGAAPYTETAAFGTLIMQF